MLVYFKTLTGKTLALDVDPQDSVRDIKVRIRDMEGIPIDQQSMILQRKRLEDACYLSDVGVEEGCTVHLVLRLRGQGDMVANHVVRHEPAANAQGVDLRTTVSVVLDDHVRLVVPQDAVRLEWTEGGFDRSVLGHAEYDRPSKTLLFRPAEPLRPRTRYQVTLRASGFRNPAGEHSIAVDHRFRFTTGEAPPVRLNLRLLQKLAAGVVEVGTQAVPFTPLAVDSPLRTLHCLAAALAGVELDDVLCMTACIVEGMPCLLEDDADVRELSPGDSVEVLLKGN